MTTQCNFFGDGIARLSCGGCRTMIASLLAGRLPLFDVTRILVVED